MFTLSSLFSCSVLWKPMWQFEYGLRILMLVIFVDNPVIIMLWMKIWVWISRKVPWALCSHPTVETLHSFFRLLGIKLSVWRTAENFYLISSFSTYVACMKMYMQALSCYVQHEAMNSQEAWIDTMCLELPCKVPVMTALVMGGC